MAFNMALQGLGLSPMPASCSEPESGCGCNSGFRWLYLAPRYKLNFTNCWLTNSWETRLSALILQ